jgi:Asp-tRNA(Asn)/Glu-tRNA(Gln) amidotransferase C subunit
MSGIDGATVRRIAELAGLEPDAGALERYARELESVLTRFRALAEEGPAPADRGAGAPGGEDDAPAGAVPAGPEGPRADADPRPGGAVLRPDVPGPEPTSGGPADLAPEWREGFFVVPSPASIRQADGDGADA